MKTISILSWVSFVLSFIMIALIIKEFFSVLSVFRKKGSFFKKLRRLKKKFKTIKIVKVYGTLSVVFFVTSFLLKYVPMLLNKFKKNDPEESEE